MPVSKELFIQDACQGKVVLDMGCIRYNADFALHDPNWLHNKIKRVAKEVVGVDCLPAEIDKLNSQGYSIIYGDVTKSLDLHKIFDVIVAGDLIEHLLNFEGFFDNCSRLLKPDGIVIITTPNPFYIDEFYFVAIKKHYLINPEHTCWIDPQALSQLAIRFGYIIKEISFIQASWKLSNLITESEKYQYDILNGKWSDNSLKFKIFRKIGGIIFNIVYWPYKNLFSINSDLVKYSDYLAVLKKRL